MEWGACCAGFIHPALHNSHTPSQLRFIAAWATDVPGCAPRQGQRKGLGEGSPLLPMHPGDELTFILNR
jgi:hypothetical protein